MHIMVLYSVLTFFIGYVIGIWHTNRDKNAKELAEFKTRKAAVKRWNKMVMKAHLAEDKKKTC